MIDAGYTQVGLAMNDFVDSQLHAIDRSTAALIPIMITMHLDTIQTQWLIQCDGMAHARLRTVGSDNEYLTKILNGFHQGMKSGSGDAVIIGHQDDWSRRGSHVFTLKDGLSEQDDRAIRQKPDHLPKLAFAIFIS